MSVLAGALGASDVVDVTDDADALRAAARRFATATDGVLTSAASGSAAWAGLPNAFTSEALQPLAGIVAAHPDRFQGFAALPTANPAAAAAELERTVTKLGFPGALINGRTGDMSMENRAFDDLYSVAARFGAPIALHPQAPTAPVREAYYSGFGDLDFILSSPAIGWHYEIGMQFLRMAIGGVFDRHPDLQVVLGHWGELVLFYLDRAVPTLEQTGLHLERPISEIVRENLWVTGSGMLSDRYFRWASEMVGRERIMTATDYPYIDNSGGATRAFVSGLPATDEERTAIAGGNWEHLTARTAQYRAAA